MKCPHGSVLIDRFGCQHVYCDKYHVILDNEENMAAYCLAGKPCNGDIIEK